MTETASNPEPMRFTQRTKLQQVVGKNPRPNVPLPVITGKDHDDARCTVTDGRILASVPIGGGCPEGACHVPPEALHTTPGAKGKMVLRTTDGWVNAKDGRSVPTPDHQRPERSAKVTADVLRSAARNIAEDSVQIALDAARLLRLAEALRNGKEQVVVLTIPSEAGKPIIVTSDHDGAGEIGLIMQCLRPDGAAGPEGIACLASNAADQIEECL